MLRDLGGIVDLVEVRVENLNAVYDDSDLATIGDDFLGIPFARRASAPFFAATTP